MYQQQERRNAVEEKMQRTGWTLCDDLEIELDEQFIVSLKDVQFKRIDLRIVNITTEEAEIRLGKKRDIL